MTYTQTPLVVPTIIPALTDYVQARVELGPLTTTFTPPASCAPMMSHFFGSASNNAMTLAQTCSDENGSPNIDNPSCWPIASQSPSNPVPLFGYGVYSPGYVCPSGYTTACFQSGGANATQASGSIAHAARFMFQYPPKNGEFAVGCCPV